MDSNGYQTVQLGDGSVDWQSLHLEVARGHKRVEVRCAGEFDVCVIIPKAELECLERTLQILSDCNNVDAMRTALQGLVSSTQHEHCSQRPQA